MVWRFAIDSGSVEGNLDIGLSWWREECLVGGSGLETGILLSPVYTSASGSKPI